MLEKKRWLVTTSFSLIAGVTATIVIVAAISTIDLFQGGFEAVVRLWKYNGVESSDSWKYAAVVSFPFAVWAGLLVWRWFMLRTRLLTKEEMDELMDEVLRSSKKK